jgi:phospholipase/carboxylesterase
LNLRSDLPLRYALRTPSHRPDSDEMPLMIIMHGRGADANDLADIAPYLDNGYRFLFPNAPNPWEAAPGMTFGFTWFDGLPPEPRSLEASRAKLATFIDDARQKFPATRLVLGGFSQGALMALDAGLRRDDVAGIVAMSGALYEADLPTLRKDQRVLIVHGTLDEMINVNLARRARRALEDRGLKPEYHEFAMGHQVTPESLEIVSEFIRTVG